MRSAITVNYMPDGDDWTVTVSCGDQTRTAKAAGLIAARDRADQLVEELVPEPAARTVVHLLDGDGVAFTNSYLKVRLGLSDPADPLPAPIPRPATGAAAAPSAALSTAPDSDKDTQTGTLPVEQPSAG